MLTATRPKPSTAGATLLRYAARLSLSALLIVSVPSISQAQSGRRPPKQPESPTPPSPKQKEPSINPSTSQDSRHKIPVTVAFYLPVVSSSAILARVVQKGCLERLAESALVTATVAARDINRRQAIDEAKTSTDAYVVWFELELDIAGRQRPSPGGPTDAQYLYVKYEVFTPSTGKTKTAGHVYQRPAGAVGSPLPSPSGTTYAGDYLLKYAGRDLADRIFDTLGVERPPRRR